MQKPWQLNAITCLTLACKFQERDDNVPLISEIIKYLVGINMNQPGQQNRFLTIKGVNYEQVTKNEVEILRVLNWNLHRITVYSFVENYLVQGIINTYDTVVMQPMLYDTIASSNIDDVFPHSAY